MQRVALICIRVLAALVLAAATPAVLAADAPSRASVRDFYLDQSADRETRLLEHARKEGQVMLYSTMTVPDGKALAGAFEKKYGIRVVHWRASAEKIVQRALAEARANRPEADVFEASASRMEALRRENQLVDFFVPGFRDLAPSAFAPGHRQFIADRFAFFVLGYNTQLVKADEVPQSYEDLLNPRWAGRMAVEATDSAWLAALVKAMGEDKGMAYFRKLAAMKPEVRSGHILGAQLVASGEIPLFITAYNNNIESLKRRGAPVEWKALQPAFGQASAIGISRQAPHPYAALLFADFVLSREGQDILRTLNRVPTSVAIDSPLNKFRHQIIDPALALDEGEKWDRVWSNLFLGGKPIPAEE